MEVIGDVRLEKYVGIDNKPYLFIFLFVTS